MDSSHKSVPMNPIVAPLPTVESMTCCCPDGICVCVEDEDDERFCGSGPPICISGLSGELRMGNNSCGCLAKLSNVCVILGRDEKLVNLQNENFECDKFTLQKSDDVFSVSANSRASADIKLPDIPWVLEDDNPSQCS